MEDPARYTREILRPLFDASQRITPATPEAGMRLYTFNFPCSFAIERIDRSCRVMLYGHGKRGTEGPMFVFTEGTPYWTYFIDQLRWLGRLAQPPARRHHPHRCHRPAVPGHPIHRGTGARLLRRRPATPGQHH